MSAKSVEKRGKRRRVERNVKIKQHRQSSSQDDVKSCPQQSDEDCGKIFRKIFTFQTSYKSESGAADVVFSASATDWPLPDPETMFKYDIWNIDQLDELKYELNSVKARLSDFDINRWHEHTSFTNPCGTVVPHLRAQYGIELCTQAWCKFHEILCTLKPVETVLDAWKGRSGEGELRSLHLCEAPGGFITSLNHYVQSRGDTSYGSRWTWRASTLNPYHESYHPDWMISDDRLMYHTLDKWLFGADESGDLMNLANLQSIIEHMKSLGDINLVTCDGSFSCQNCPDEQERMVSPLHYCEIVASLKILCKGGSMVIKLFTVFECTSVCLVYLLCCTFTKVTFFKPGTSKPGNSEVYVVCVGYIGNTDTAVLECLQQLSQRYGPEQCEKAIFPLDKIPASFIERLLLCCATFKDSQSETICENIDWFNDMSDETRTLIGRRRKVCEALYVKKMEICRIDPKNRICKNAKGFLVTPMSHQMFSTNRLVGSYNDRVANQSSGAADPR